MKLTLLQENLQSGLNTVSRAVATRPTLPVLSNILLKTENGRLKLMATDLDLSISTFVGAKIEKEGETTVPGKIITELVSNLPAGQLDLELQEGLLLISSPFAMTKLNTIDASEFPSLKKQEEQIRAFQIETKSFRKALSQVLFAAAVDDSRPILTGILMHFKGNSLILAGVDGFRLSEKKLNLKEDVGEELRLVVPTKALQEVVRLVGDEEEASLQVLKKNQIVFVKNDIEIYSRLLEGQFPNYTSIIPVSYNTSVKMNTQELKEAVRVSSLFARTSGGNIKFSFNSSDNLIALLSTAAEIGENEVKIEAPVEGDNLEIAFNSRFLSDFLSNFSDEEVIFEAASGSTPGVFKSPSDPNFLHLIMPMRI